MIFILSHETHFRFGLGLVEGNIVETTIEIEIIEHSQDIEEFIAVEAPDIESDIVENSVTLGDEAIEVDLESSAEKADPPEEEIIEQVLSESDKTAAIKETAENEVVAVRTESELVSIYATAVIEDSPYATYPEHIDTLESEYF